MTNVGTATRGDGNLRCRAAKLNQGAFAATNSLLGYRACTPTLPSTSSVMLRSTTALENM